MTGVGNMAEGSPVLVPRLMAYLHPGAPALMLTTGADGYPASAYTWVVAPDAMRLRFGVDVGSSSMANLQRSGRAAIQVIGPGDISFLVKGEAGLIKERIEAAAPAKVMLWELAVTTARDQSWPGVSTTALSYEWPADKREAMLRMEQAVYAEMRLAP
jgi:hypothetical protein